MIYSFKIKKINNVYVDVQVDYQDINIDDEAPCGVEYRKQCSSSWSETRQEQWWDFVDFVLNENNILLSDFVFVWNVEVEGVIYGIDNNPI